MSVRLTRGVALAALAAVFIAFFALDLDRFATLDALKSQQAVVEAYRDANPWRAAALFFVLYVVITAASLPAGAVMTIAAGALFGLGLGTLLASFASSIGGTLAFLSSRFLLRDVVLARFGPSLAAVNDGIAKDGALYLFSVRMVPAFPFFIVNVLMGLTPVSTGTFYAVSQAGMLPVTMVFVNAGTQLARVHSVSDILSPGLLASFVLLAAFPLLAKAVIGRLRIRALYAPWAHRRPARFDNNVVVIGAGSAGLVSAYIAAAVRAKVTLVERHKMGGECLHTGCVPSKALLKSAMVLSHIKRAPEFGIRSAIVRVRLRRRDGARPARDRGGGAARLGGALHAPRRDMRGRERRGSLRRGQWR